MKVRSSRSLNLQLPITNTSLILIPIPPSYSRWLPVPLYNPTPLNNPNSYRQLPLFRWTIESSTSQRQYPQKFSYTSKILDCLQSLLIYSTVRCKQCRKKREYLRWHMPEARLCNSTLGSVTGAVCASHAHTHTHGGGVRLLPYTHTHTTTAGNDPVGRVDD